MEAKWLGHKSDGSTGVVIGFDTHCEWMAKWWYNNYHEYNAHPICVADFGMSNSMHEWCKSVGTVIDLKFNIGKNWFKKPFAILASPFDKIIWVDIDCEVRGKLDPLFDYASKGLGVTLDPHSRFCKNKGAVASGVVVASHDNPLVAEWANKCINTKLRGDQEVLNSIIASDRSRLVIMPPEYQWLRLDGNRPDVLIMHWTGDVGKNTIRGKMGLKFGQKRVKPIKLIRRTHQLPVKNILPIRNARRTQLAAVRLNITKPIRPGR